MIIHRAFIREVLRTCGAVSAILLAIFLVVRLMSFLRQAVDGDIPANSVLLLLLLKTITYLDILVPLVLYVSTLLVMGRWIRDNELTIISACGIGMSRLLKPAMVLAAVVGSFVALFSLYLSPLSTEASRAIIGELRHRTDVSAVMPGVFNEIRGSNGVYFVESYEQDEESGVFHNLFIYGGEQGKEVVVADTGRKVVDEKTNDDFLVLKNGSRYRGTAGDAEYTVADFETYGLRLKQHPRQPGRSTAVEAMPTWTLLGTGPRATGELHWRISKVIMLPILMVFTLAFSSLTYRKNRFPGMLSALLVYFAYANFLGLGVTLIRRGATHPHLTLWVVHLAFLGLAIYLLQRRNANQPLLPIRSRA